MHVTLKRCPYFIWYLRFDPNFIVVEFYAPWCGPVKETCSEYEKAAPVLSQNDPPVVLAKVDANEEKNKILASEFDIRGFPTIKILRKQSGPASAEIKSSEDADAFINVNNIIIVGVFPEFSGEKFENFTALAGASELTMILEFDVDALAKLVEEAAIPTVTVYNKDPNNHPFVIKFFNNPNAKAMLFVNFNNDLFDSFKSKYHEVAEQYKGNDLSFLIGDVEASQGAFQYFGLKEDQIPLIIIQTSDGEKYLKPNIEPDHIASWVKEFKGDDAPAFTLFLLPVCLGLIVPPRFSHPLSI
ncbi:hypothetical protein HAX54_045577 [Datura stramonium]|uniref:protein disulfide-isomerase n=1 Tax=Datura stramonium TaxID=4076 RepID=A0ABS8SQG0_DATST|nr:hypothetical protein [Datura stramonium]